MLCYVLSILKKFHFQDIYGMTPMDIALKLERQELKSLLSHYIEDYQYEYSVRPILIE